MHQRHAAILNIDGLGRLSRATLRDLWARELGEDPPPSIGRDILALGIAYAMQERLQGGLTKPVAKELDRLFDRMVCEGEADTLCAPVTQLPRTGTVLVREWQGTTHHVTITADGFIWNGHRHSSLSNIASAITGTKWNGPRFFGMREVRRSEGSHDAK